MVRPGALAVWKLLLQWVSGQKSVVAIGLSLTVFGVVLILRYQYDTWWPWGIALSFLLAMVGLINFQD